MSSPLSFRRVYTERDTADSLLTKTTKLTQGISRGSKIKTLFQALFLGKNSLPFLCRRTIVATHVVLFPVFFFFFGLYFVARGHCHVVNSNAVSVLSLSGLDTETMEKLPRASPTWNSWSFLLWTRGHNHHGYLFSNTTRTWRDFDPAHYDLFQLYPLPCSQWYITPFYSQYTVSTTFPCVVHNDGTAKAQHFLKKVLLLLNTTSSTSLWFHKDEL